MEGSMGGAREALAVETAGAASEVAGWAMGGVEEARADATEPLLAGLAVAAAMAREVAVVRVAAAARVAARVATAVARAKVARAVAREAARAEVATVAERAAGAASAMAPRFELP